LLTKKLPTTQQTGIQVNNSSVTQVGARVLSTTEDAQTQKQPREAGCPTWHITVSIQHIHTVTGHQVNEQKTAH